MGCRSGVRRTAYFKELLFLFVVFSLPARANSPKFYRIVYNDDPLLKRVGQKRLEEAYGAQLIVIPPSGSPPKKAVHYPGVVIHVDPESDKDWAIGEQNPSLEAIRFKDRIPEILGLSDIKDIDEKYDEYRFLSTIAPQIGPPKMKLLSEYANHVHPSVDMNAVAAKVDQTMKTHGMKEPEVRARMIKLEAVRQSVLADPEMGPAFLKNRFLNHSEGKLPKSHKEWLDLYALYLKETKPRVLKIEKEIEGTSGTLADKIVHLPHIEGRVLDTLLDEPESIIAQKKVDIHREVRTHVIQLEVLPATFLRFYELNEYLPDIEREIITRALKKYFIEPLKARGQGFERFSCTPDVIIEKRPGLEEALAKAKHGDFEPALKFVRILDGNSGMDSGYLYPEEDLFTTAEFSYRFTGVKPTILGEFDAFKALPLGAEKGEALKSMVKKYAPFMEGDVKEAFWDRVSTHCLDLVRADPRDIVFHRILMMYRAAGLRDEMPFMSFVAQVQDTWPELKLSERLAQAWAHYFNAIEPKISTEVVGGKLIDKPIFAGCGLPLLKVGAINR